MSPGLRRWCSRRRVSFSACRWRNKAFIMKSVFSIIFVFVFLTASGCYAKGPWRGKVIDAETKQPIEGAAVLATWKKDIPTPAGAATYFLDAEETITDKNGEFKIPSKKFVKIPGIRLKGPFFTIFKPSYGSYPEYARIKILNNTHRELFGNISDVVVELPKLKTREERIKKKPGISDPFIDHEQKKKYFIKLLRQESLEIGLEPEGPRK